MRLAAGFLSRTPSHRIQKRWPAVALAGIALLVVVLLATPISSLRVFPGPFQSQAPSGGTAPSPYSPPWNGTALQTIIIVGADWLISYDGQGPAYLGPTNQSLCSNCPVRTTVGASFTLTFSLTNRGTTNRSVAVGDTYFGCDPPFRRESTVPGGTFDIAAGQTLTISVIIWADKATPGVWTFVGSVGTS